MIKRQSFLGRHGLWIAFVAVAAPLAVLLGLQYSWLVDLEQTSAIARKAALGSFLDAAATKAEYFYKQQAEQTLNLPSELFTEDRLDKSAFYFKKRGHAGVRFFFVYSFSADYDDSLYFYDCATRKMVQDVAPDRWRAVMAASAPWKVLSYKGTVFESVPLSVDEKDPTNRIILNPVTNERSQVVGVAGMILDQEYLHGTLLPAIFERSFARLNKGDLVVSVRDGKGNVLYATGAAPDTGEQAVRSIPFVFSDWQLSLHSLESTPEQWARTNFSLNITLSMLLAAVLIAGIVLALRTASHEIHISQMKADFVSNVSHELRTPIASIRVFAELLRHGRVGREHKVREYGEFIETESRRLTQLIDNILDFAKIESGRKIYRFGAHDVAAVVEDTLRTYGVRLRHEGFRIRFDRPIEPCTARIDREAIGQALGNLLDNAVKYSGESRDITIRLFVEADYVALSVTDYGIGISEGERHKIFERFHRVGTGLVHDVRGSGLGLSIVSHIVQAHGGKVSVESEPGVGSTFTVFLSADGVEPVRPAADRVVPAMVQGGGET